MYILVDFSSFSLSEDDEPLSFILLDFFNLQAVTNYLTLYMYYIKCRHKLVNNKYTNNKMEHQ